MISKPVIISSSGLKNIFLSKYREEEDFVFIFGSREVRMKSFFAEFISPFVSNIHKSDPTINCINIGEIIKADYNNFNELSKSILTEDTISLFLQISSGNCIEINETQAIKIRILSTILGNEELHTKINELFPENYCKFDIDFYMKNLASFYYFSAINTKNDISNTVRVLPNRL